MADKRDEGKHWLKKANNALSASEALVSEELFDDAISRAYYAMFYAAKALLIRDGVIAGSKHSAVVAAFGREYAKTGKIEPRYHQMLIEDFEWRQKVDYDVFWHADRETAQGRVADAREFVSLISKIFISADRLELEAYSKCTPIPSSNRLQGEFRSPQDDCHFMVQPKIPLAIKDCRFLLRRLKVAVLH